MTINPEESVSDVQEDAISTDETAAEPTEVVAKKSPKKKAAVKRKPKAATSKRRTPVARPVAPPPPPLTLQELKQQGTQAKEELVSAVLEPALEAVGSLSQTIRDTIGGAFAGLLSRKRRGD